MISYCLLSKTLSSSWMCPVHITAFYITFCPLTTSSAQHCTVGINKANNGAPILYISTSLYISAHLVRLSLLAHSHSHPSPTLYTRTLHAIKVNFFASYSPSSRYTSRHKAPKSWRQQIFGKPHIVPHCQFIYCTFHPQLSKAK